MKLALIFLLFLHSVSNALATELSGAAAANLVRNATVAKCISDVETKRANGRSYVSQMVIDKLDDLYATVEKRHIITISGHFGLEMMYGKTEIKIIKVRTGCGEFTSYKYSCESDENSSTLSDVDCPTFVDEPLDVTARSE